MTKANQNRTKNVSPNIFNDDLYPRDTTPKKKDNLKEPFRTPLNTF